jgi:hypothetical protein
MIKKRKIGILTFHNVYNYGGTLQAFGLLYALREHDVLCVDYVQEARNEHYNSIVSKNYSLKQNIKNIIKKGIFKEGEQKRKAFDLFFDDHLKLTENKYTSSEALKEIENFFDILISGSDQIWNPFFSNGLLDTNYLLGFTTSVKKMAYASSAGSYSFSKEEKETMAKYLKTFAKIGVRESFLKEQLDEVIDGVETVLDPTLLLRAKDWRTVSKPLNIKDNFVLLYSFDHNETCLEIANIVAEKLNCKVLSICPKLFNNKGVDIGLKNVGPSEFIWLFDNAKYVVTNSFHGTCFSVIFRKNFVSLYKKNNPYRVLNMLKIMGLSDRVVKSTNDMSEVNWDIDYSSLEETIEKEVVRSNQFLSVAIENI